MNNHKEHNVSKDGLPEEWYEEQLRLYKEQRWSRFWYNLKHPVAWFNGYDCPWYHRIWLLPLFCLLFPVIFAIMLSPIIIPGVFLSFWFNSLGMNEENAIGIAELVIFCLIVAYCIGFCIGKHRGGNAKK